MDHLIFFALPVAGVALILGGFASIVALIITGG